MYTCQLHPWMTAYCLSMNSGKATYLGWLSYRSVWWVVTAERTHRVGGGGRSFFGGCLIGSGGYLAWSRRVGSCILPYYSCMMMGEEGQVTIRNEMFYSVVSSKILIHDQLSH